VGEQRRACEIGFGFTEVQGAEKLGAMFYDLNLPVDPADTRSVTPSRNLRESLAMAMYHGAMGRAFAGGRLSERVLRTDGLERVGVQSTKRSR
jgi:hypothetical protein